ncbi:MAG: hypothetical protein IM638_08685 [Bacteroidetes bacterium]|nr:hypothetical protein [Bacteroidota bacterium]
MLASGLFSGQTSLKPDCIIGHKIQFGGCEPGLGGCLIAYPPDQPWLGDKISITLYQPSETNEGASGIQMAIVFNDKLPSGNDVFMNGQEGDTEVCQEYVLPLQCTGITVLANSYPVQYDNRFSNGYVIVDVKVVE